MPIVFSLNSIVIFRYKITPKFTPTTFVIIFKSLTFYCFKMPNVIRTTISPFKISNAPQIQAMCLHPKVRVFQFQHLMPGNFRLNRRFAFAYIFVCASVSPQFSIKTMSMHSSGVKKPNGTLSEFIYKPRT